MYPWMQGLLIITVLIFIAAIWFSWQNDAAELNWGWRILIVLVFLFTLLAAINFRRLLIVVTDEQLICGFGIFRRAFPLNKINTVEIGVYSFGNYWGYGVRFGRDNTLGYVPRGGAGIKLEIQGERRAIFVSTQRPEEVKKILEAR